MDATSSVGRAPTSWASPARAVSPTEQQAQALQAQVNALTNQVNSLGAQVATAQSQLAAVKNIAFYPTTRVSTSFPTPDAFVSFIIACYPFTSRSVSSAIQ